MKLGKQRIQNKKSPTACQGWRDENNEHASSEWLFGLRLKGLGLEQRRMSEGRRWQGIMAQASLE
jgi:hypothetical protein